MSALKPNYIRNNSNEEKPSLKVKKTPSTYKKNSRPIYKRSESVVALEDLVVCGVCLGQLQEPRVLLCQHTFCLTCLHATEYVVECPTCQYRTDLDKGPDGLKKLPRNVYIDSILRLLGDNEFAISQEARCVKCQTLCQSQPQNCQHCKQMFCKICWTEHISELEHNLIALSKQLTDSETRLQYKVDHAEARYQQLKYQITRASEAKIAEIKLREAATLNKIDEMKVQGTEAVKNLGQRIKDMEREIENFKLDFRHDGSQKVNNFMILHRSTGTLLDEISRWGETRIIFDPAAFSVDELNETHYDKELDDGKLEIEDMKDPLENANSLITHYRSRKFTPKLVWTKCPRLAGVGIPPWDITILYVAATDSRAVLILNRKTNKVKGRLTSPDMLCLAGLAFSAVREEIYVSDKWQHCIHVFSKNGEALRTLCTKGSSDGKIRSPEGIAVSPKDEIVLCDTGNDRVLVLDPTDGHHILKIGLVGRRTELNAPTGVAVHHNKIVVMDNGNHRVKLFSLSGEKLYEFGSLGGFKGQFRSAEVVAIDPLGFILVGDSGNARVQIFKPDGTLVRILGGSETCNFKWISGLAVAPDLDIVTTDHKNRCLQIF